MQKLGALDANFLYNESDLMPNHIASVQRLELPEGVEPGQFIESLKDFLMARRHLVPYMYRKLKFVPGNFDHPFWVYDDAFDMDNHVVEVPVPAPGDLAQLEQTIAGIHEIRMDRDKPLWNMYVLTGLEDGTVAYYSQVHHSAIDGMGGQAATMLLMDETPDHPEIECPESFPPVRGDEMAEMARMTLENLLKFQIGNASRVLGSMESMRRMMQRAMDPSRHFGAFGQRAPATRFNKSIGKSRSYAVGEFPLQDIRTMGREFGCTVNDVFMAICAGGLRRYLERREELPAAGLIAGCPVSLRSARDRDMGNRITMMNVNLSTQVKDPKLRLLAISQSSQVAKEVTADLAHGYDPNVSLPGLPAMIAMSAAAAEGTRAADMMAPPINLVISNVPGPRNTLYSNGARMLTHYPVSIPAHGVGLNITVQSYVGSLYFSITACAAALPDAQRLRDDMLSAYLELREALLPTNVSTLRPQAPKSGVENDAAAEETDRREPLTRVA
ncbi:MAG TPA: wax ester/triacylglycerol synthase family O-acyltransferase [Pseudomonadales bacterium]|nr:wax ester/triacylglycerol synthase family O-acyltransferase [Pseudomonadales bacterium]